jgi:putative hemolysin
MYLRIGSRVCGPPIYDASFGTVDFFVVFDLQEMAPKYRGMFLGS